MEEWSIDVLQLWVQHGAGCRSRVVEYWWNTTALGAGVEACRAVMALLVRSPFRKSKVVSQLATWIVDYNAISYWQLRS